MHKPLLISVLLLLLVSVAPGQSKKYIYIDSTLVQSDRYGNLVPVEEAVDEEVVVASPEASDLPVPVEESPAAATDTTLYLNGHSIERDSVVKWKKERAYAYARNLDSLLRALQQEEMITVKKPRRISFPVQLLQFVLWAGAGAFVLFIIYRLFLADGVFRRETKKSKQLESFTETEMLTADSDFDGLIRQALAQRNLRLAIRYHYLRVLHRLEKAGHLTLAPDKTNYQYVQELANPAWKNEFATLTLNYEYAWFGEFGITQDIYDRVETGFKQFNQKI